MRDRNKYITVGVLTCINLLNYMDRFTIAGILNNLEDPKRNGFSFHHHSEEVDDTLGGLLQTAFIGSYMILSPIFGYLGDRYKRKLIITVGILLWSAFTLLGSFSVNYWMLFSTRLVVGVGEASYATIAPTMIADLFPPEKRLRVLAVFYIAMPVGSAFGYMVGSEVSVLVHHFFHQHDSWRWALRVTPTLGVICALIVFFVVKEPVRGSSEQRLSKGVRGKTGFKAYLADLWYLCKNFTFVTSTMGFTAVAFTTGALAQWAPIFIQRVSAMLYPGHGYGDSTGAIGFGGMAVVAGILGTVMGSELSKFLGRHTRKAEAIVCCMSMMVGTPFLFMALVVVQYKVIYVSWACVFFATLSTCLVWTPVSAMLLYSVVPAKRATASSVQILLSHLFGDSVSPTIVGVISDAVYRYVGPAQGYDTGKAVSMEFGLLTTAVVMLLGGGAFLMSTLFVDHDRRKVELAAQKVNSHIQRKGQESVGSISGEDSEGGDQERKELLPDPDNPKLCRERKHVSNNVSSNNSSVSIKI